MKIIIIAYAVTEQCNVCIDIHSRIVCKRTVSENYANRLFYFFCLKIILTYLK